ncbi:MAG: DUF6273 domain-containing protein [Enterocloster sp.]
MAVLTQTVTTETAINWEELAQKIKDNTSGLKAGDIITEKTLDGEEMDLVVVDMGPGWARFESKDCLPVEVAYNQNNRNACGFADSDVKRYLNEEVFNNLPEELRNVIAEVERKQENGESSLCRLFFTHRVGAVRGLLLFRGRHIQPDRILQGPPQPYQVQQKRRIT